MNLDTIVVDLVNNLISKGETVIYQTTTPYIEELHTLTDRLQVYTDEMTQSLGPVRSFVYMDNGTFWLSYDPMDYGYHVSHNLPPSDHFGIEEVERLRLEKFGDAWYLTRRELDAGRRDRNGYT
jgi:hypothetical protein